jgi:hypothetical protein
LILVRFLNVINIYILQRRWGLVEGRIEGTRKAEINMRFSEFEMPPMQDVLIVGKRAPIGPEAARRMVDILSPEQYEIVRLEHQYVEAVVVRKSLINMVEKDKLISIIMEEGGKVANESMIIRAQVSITLHVSKSIDL